MKALPWMLPCARCGAHLRRFLRRKGSTALAEAAASRAALERLLVAAHDDVRRRTSTTCFEAFDPSDAPALYDVGPLRTTAALWTEGRSLRR